MAGAEPERARGRWVALDLLRFCAVFLMVQGHVFTELLDPAVRAERWYRHHAFVHGYTAPMFLFASGLAFGYTTFRAWAANTRAGDALWKRFRRYGWLVLIGYALHLPSTSLLELASLDDARLRALFQVDVLQHIGVSLAICQGLALVLRCQRRFAVAIGVLFLLTVLTAPLVYGWDVEAALPLWLAAFVNESTGSLFPLVPWAGFTYAGILCAYFARHARVPSRDLAWPLAFAAALALLVPIAINRTGWNPYGLHNFWRTSPYYFFWRLGNVMAVLALLCFAERWAVRTRLIEDPRALASRALDWARIVGQESLIIYVAHLLVLYDSVLGRGLRTYTGGTLSLVQASLVALALFSAMVLLARVWAGFKQREARFRSLQLAATSAVVYFLLAG
jgi:uncharacterized membrane protein